MRIRPRFANPTPSWPVLEEKDDEIVQFYGDVVRHTVPIVTGLAFAATPYVVGGIIVAFAPPWLKPIGVAMLVPSPADLAYFALGYAAGAWLVEEHPMFDWIDE